MLFEAFFPPCNICCSRPGGDDDIIHVMQVVSKTPYVNRWCNMKPMYSSSSSKMKDVVIPPRYQQRCCRLDERLGRWPLGPGGMVFFSHALMFRCGQELYFSAGTFEHPLLSTDCPSTTHNHTPSCLSARFCWQDSERVPPARDTWWRQTSSVCVVHFSVLRQRDRPRITIGLFLFSRCDLEYFFRK